ncbi:DUF3422 domain-containing protein [Mesobacterium sp. TK19101]|uniref:DUF3422 domain-containing protein n=1 Tax=Mesobacterium hydrothermale TaxID=3111907 RepID=A0ABU6HMS9_9RHOB|nr:DUF3422 domain-containing protein [Mesobacterium sp. TK19101]MEC3863229.1 DUF3422 domain-containing protein [Mesobacterium sp. TK19101]
MPPIQDHPLRYALANELHARPFPSLKTPCRAVYLAVKKQVGAVTRDREEDRRHLIALLDRYGTQHPQPGTTHFSGQIGQHMLKWEQHTEFVTYTVFMDGVGDRPFDPADFDVFPDDWLDQAPGFRLTSALIRVAERPADEAQIDAELQKTFVQESLAASRVIDDEAVVGTDFRIDPAGQMRFAVYANPGIGARRVGRIVQRLCEVETYKAMSMLGFSRVRQISPRMGEIDDELTRLMSDMTQSVAQPEQTLKALLSVSEELESLSAQMSFRFGATEAYEALVAQRIQVLREDRFRGRQSFREFMARRYDPAMRTVKSARGRLETMSNRAMRAGDLLRTRVEVQRSAQNQQLLESMNQRADLQLRLQKTVEGLSVVAISYYAVSLAGYVLYPLSGVTGLSKGMITAMVTPVVVLAVWLMIRRIHHKIEKDGH